MQTVSNDNFGPLIAYLVPGATALLGLAQFFPMVRDWLTAPENTGPTIGGFLYLTLASLAVGMVVSALRWLIVDTLHSCTGVRSPPLDFATLGDKAEAFNLLIEIHYRHYQFHANMFIAIALAYGSFALVHGWSPTWMDVVVLALECVLFATSRDNLRKYLTRSAQLLAKRL